MSFDLVVSGRAFVKGEIKYSEIGITDGKIASVKSSVKGGEKRIDVPGGVILPGFIDPHVHFRDPGMTEKEDFSSGTLSAVHGGVTCVLDMPNTLPPVTDVSMLLDKKDHVKGKAYADYGLFAAVTPGCSAGMLAPLVPGFKLFMGSTTGKILLNDDAEIISTFRDIALTGKRISVHAEDDRMISKEKENNCRDHLRNRPVEAEINALRRLSRFKGMKINICHNTNAESVALAGELGFTTEVTMHHLFFEADKFSSSEYKVNPPIRNSAVRDKLYRSFINGKISMFGSDHAPHTLSDKSKDFDEAPSGIPGVETTIPMVMNMVRNNTITLKQAVSMGSETPAAAFGMRKGRIEEGCDADLSVFDTRNFAKINVRKLHSKAGHSPYEGWEAVFPDIVMVRGEVQIEGGEFCGEKVGKDAYGKH
ncbi:dihydroorotase [Candidatus Methanoplasma termitum]|uniref:Dihydroorotase n=1 Tax=Candidatus Methanoplasma termitum TaxID=1577791 RepID=A0A0A7LGT8_9ARCH|nr:dihydroorotase family protein [Candidatus Methanoplasma termitum]AIZ56711.1 dihydroorotase [Candidatus Methanoplasma termitum]MCL2333355.1 dihydroorotase family protein [Candidatus Methanoplasma sp.]